jgi:predicted membrane channel-forming protein YqfA (hemolysin III family)
VSDPNSPKAILRLRLAVLLTALSVVLAITLLIKETAYVFSIFMILGPLLLLVAVVLLGWNILAELRAKKVL